MFFKPGNFLKEEHDFQLFTFYLLILVRCHFTNLDLTVGVVRVNKKIVKLFKTFHFRM